MPKLQKKSIQNSRLSWILSFLFSLPSRPCHYLNDIGPKAGVLLIPSEEIHKFGNQFLPIGLAMAAAHLAPQPHRSAPGCSIVPYPLIPAVGLAAAVILLRILYPMEIGRAHV